MLRVCDGIYLLLRHVRKQDNNIAKNKNKNIATAIKSWPTTVLSREVGCCPTPAAGVWGRSECGNTAVPTSK